jgi:hypothetical protein
MVGLPPPLAGRRFLGLAFFSVSANVLRLGLPKQRSSAEISEIALQPPMNRLEIRLLRRERFDYAIGPASLIAAATAVGTWL